MLDRLFGFKIHDYLQVLGLFILAFGVSMNKVLMSIGTIWLAANLLLKADFTGYWSKWKNNYIFWFVVSVLGLHLIGLLYTENFNYAFRDLNTKLPLFVIPIALVGFPIQKRFFNPILYGFLIALSITSVINWSFMVKNEAEDYRNFSLFGSHIRYSLLIVTGVLVSVYLWMNNKKLGFLFLILIIWFLYYTLISQVFSGYIALFFLLFGVFIFFIKKLQAAWIRNLIVFFVLGWIAFGSIQAYNYLRPNLAVLNFDNLPERSEHGGLYYHDTTVLWFENGHHIMSNISGDELKELWGTRSTVDFYAELEGGYQLKNILLRYMTSKGLTKDKMGMLQMTDQDIKNVENGLSSVTYTYGTLRRKMAELKSKILHYSIGSDPDGNSLLQRLEHWKAGEAIIKEHWLIGVGTGDVQNVFNHQYLNSDSQLETRNWNRAHNQFMTFWITFGLLGFIIFTCFWFWFLWRNIMRNNLIGIGFGLIAIASFLSEDTIETQQGVTYIALFLGLSSMMNSYFRPETNKL
jgi:hypothetical protein